MPAYDPDLPTTDANERPQAAITRASRDDARDDARDPAGVIVWRTVADGAAAAADSGPGAGPLTPRLAHHLVAIYSNADGTVVDLDADDTLRHAAEAAGRRYLAVTDLTSLPTPADSSQAAGLIVLRWPRPAGDPGQDAESLLRACQHHLAADGAAIVAVTAAATGQPGTSYAEHEQALLPAAQAASLHHLHDIVPLPATDGRDAFTYATAPDTTARDATTARDTAASDHDSRTDTPARTTSTTLMIFCHPGRQP
jgi:hypothetical protein